MNISFPIPGRTLPISLVFHYDILSKRNYVLLSKNFWNKKIISIHSDTCQEFRAKSPSPFISSSISQNPEQIIFILLTILLFYHFCKQNSIPFNESSPHEYNKERNSYANLRKYSIKFVINLPIISLNSIKLQSLSLI